MDTRDALRSAIKKAGISQQELGRKLGVPQSLISYWLNKAKAGIAAEHVRAAAEITGVPPHELRPDIFLPPTLKAERAA